MRVCVFLAETLTEMDEAETALQGTRVLLRQRPLTSARPAAADTLSHCALVNGRLLAPCKTHAHTHTKQGRVGFSSSRRNVVHARAHARPRVSGQMGNGLEGRVNRQ